MVNLAIDLLTSICSFAVPVAVVFYIGYMIVDSFFNVAFAGGRLWTRRN